MQHHPLNPAAHATPVALQAFLEAGQEAARRAGRPQLVSISVAVESLDPLAVLESIFEPGELHFYAERPAQGYAVAGAETAVEFSAGGPGRFAAARAPTAAARPNEPRLSVVRGLRSRRAGRPRHCGSAAAARARSRLAHDQPALH